MKPRWALEAGRINENEKGSGFAAQGLSHFLGSVCRACLPLEHLSPYPHTLPHLQAFANAVHLPWPSDRL